MKPSAIILARSGSRGIKNKNVKILNNKPLICHSIDACLNSKIFKNIIISTDSNNYIKIIKKFSKNKKIIFFKRSKKFAFSNSSSESSINEILVSNLFLLNEIFLIQATSPLITGKDLKLAYKIFNKKDVDTVLSVCEFKKFIWKKTKNKKFIKPINYNYKKRPMRQNFKSCFIENGAFYVFSKKGFKKNKSRLYGNIAPVLMDKERSIDIDEKKDFEKVEKIIKKYKK